MCTHPFAKEALTLHLARSEGRERYFGCNLMHRNVLASHYQHLMTEAPASVAAAAGSLTAWSTLKRCDEGALFLPIVGEWMMQEVARGQPNGLTAFDNGTDDVGSQECITDCLAHAVRWDGVFGGNLLIGFCLL